jgi:coenzyme PQQ precursor peptide PqqA
MPKDGALILSDVRVPMLAIVRAMRAPRVLRHLQGSSKQHGDTKLTVLLQTLADCPKARFASIYDRCKARLMNTPASTPRCIELIFVSSEGIKARVAELTRCAPHQRAQTRRRNDAMVWSTPEVREVCVGMEVTSYLSAEM